MIKVTSALALALLAGMAVGLAPVRLSAQPAAPGYLTPGDLDPTRLLPPPPADGSPRQTAELAEVHRLLQDRTAERLAQAVWDDKHENISLFAESLGPAFDITKLPATAAVLGIVDSERKRAEGAKAFFKRKRPWAFDPSIIPCDGGHLTKDPLSGYPSGHSLTGYSLGIALANLLPEKAQAIEARASDYAYSREICGAHYHSDTEASHVMAMALVMALFLNPTLAPRFEAARAELRAAGLTQR